MNELVCTLTAISAGAVFMSANTYIGNTSNLMVKTIAEQLGVKMPNFFGYTAWFDSILIPFFIRMRFIWFQ
jgi:Na+/H+ antiporter NhaD/arsenite permease-like protein